MEILCFSANVHQSNIIFSVVHVQLSQFEVFFIHLFNNNCTPNTYLLLAECEVSTASYGPSFFLIFYGLSAKRADHESKEGKKRGSITCRMDRANEDNKMFIIWLC